MGFAKAVVRCYGNMLNFTGRARRAEFWWFTLWQFLLSVGGTSAAGYYMAARAQSDPALAAALGSPEAIELYMASMLRGYGFHIFVGYMILFAIPNLSVTIRRLHDTNRSGWNIFMPMLVGILSVIVGFLFLGAAIANDSSMGAVVAVVAIYIPALIASIVFLVWLCLPGTHGTNRFGDDSAPGRKRPVIDHPAFAGEMQGADRDRSEIARKAAAQDYYKRRVLPSIQKA